MISDLPKNAELIPNDMTEKQESIRILPAEVRFSVTTKGESYFKKKITNSTSDKVLQTMPIYVSFLTAAIISAATWLPSLTLTVNNH